MTRIIGGIDEAGRGPSLGPMIICGITFSEEDIPKLANLKVRDSKLIPSSERENLSQKITSLAKQIEIITISAKEIDTQRAKGINLNEIEFRAFEDILKILKSDLTYIDCPDVIPSRLCSRLMNLQNQNKLIVEHKADLKYLACSAASIIAKVHRDSVIETLAEKHGDIGTGYMTDPKTQHFLQSWLLSHNVFPDFVRSSWEPCRKMLGEKGNTKLKDYFPDE